MKTIKKAFLALLCIGVVLSATACGARDNNAGDNMTNDATAGDRENTTDNGVGEDIKDGVDNMGNAIDDGMNAVGDGIQDMTDDMTDSNTNNNQETR